MKEIKINIPEGYEIDKENSTFECIKFKKKFPLSYEEIQNLVRSNSSYTNSVCCCLKHEDKLTIYRMLLEVAEYLNNRWEPDWNNTTQRKYFIDKDYDGTYIVNYCNVTCNSSVYFKSSELAEQAIKIIGKEKLNLLFN